jgi:hypothetical protein
MSSNQGVVIKGGQQTIGQMVAGTGARAEMHIEADSRAARDDLSRQVETIIRLLEEKQSEVDEGPFLLGSARRVTSEVAKPEPDKGKLSSLLNMLAEGTKDLTSIASLVATVKALATTVFALV